MWAPKTDYLKKVSREASVIARRLKREGHPEPLGDPASGLVVVLDQPVGPRAIEALANSLERVNLSAAYVTWSSTGLLAEEILSLQPAVLVSIGPGAASEIDALDSPLSLNTFREASPGVWFPWTSSVYGLSLPALAPALSDENAKRNFWRAFMSLRRTPVPTYR